MSEALFSNPAADMDVEVAHDKMLMEKDGDHVVMGDPGEVQDGDESFQSSLEINLNRWYQQSNLEEKMATLYIFLKCPEHDDMDFSTQKGLLLIPGDILSSVQGSEVSQWIKTFPKGCEVDGCTTTISDAITFMDNHPENYLCTFKDSNHSVSWVRGDCPAHDRDQAESVIRLLVLVVKQFKRIQKTLLVQGHSWPNMEVNSKTGGDTIKTTLILPISVGSALHWGTAIVLNSYKTDEIQQIGSSYRQLISTFLSFTFGSAGGGGKRLRDAEELDKVKGQQKRNESKMAIDRNRPREETVEKMSPDQVQKHLRGDWLRTSLTRKASSDSFAGLPRGFTDLDPHQEITQISFSTNVSGDKAVKPVIINQTVLVTKSWDNSGRCTTCTNNHSIIRKEGTLWIVISDQHSPAVIGQEGACAATWRGADMGIVEMLTHLFRTLSRRGVNFPEKMGISQILLDAHEADMKVILSISSGTSFFKDGPGAYVKTAQNLIALLGQLNYTNIKQVLFPTPLIPYVKEPNKDDGTSAKISKLTLEATILAKLIAVNNKYEGTPTFRTAKADQFMIDTKLRPESYQELAGCLKFSTIRRLGSREGNSNPANIVLEPMSYRWPAKERSRKNHLTFEALAGYAHAIFLDMAAASANADLTNYPVPENLDHFKLIRRCRPNMLMPPKLWTELVNKSMGSVICVNPTVHTDSPSFNTEADLKDHGRKCYANKF